MPRSWRRGRVMSHIRAFHELRKRAEKMHHSGIDGLEMAAFDVAKMVGGRRPLHLLVMTDMEEPKATDILGQVQALLEKELRVPVRLWNRFDLPPHWRAELLPGAREVF